MSTQPPPAPFAAALPSSNYVRIFDTTLRDGEQSPGATLSSSEKLEVARALGRLGVDVIEAGFPAASPDDLVAVRSVAESVGQEVRGEVETTGGLEGAASPVQRRPSSEPPIICALARAAESDIDRAWEAVQHAKSPRIHLFLATSPIHREHKLRMSRKQVMERVAQMVAYARRLCVDIEFSPEDAGRTEPDFLHDVLGVAIEAGATTLNIPDTVGYTVPEEFGALIHGIRTQVRHVEQAVISVHCHNDLGLATANTLAGLRAGARQAEVAVNGIGERAGNTALEEVVMALRTRQTYFGLRTGVDTTQLTRVSRLVSARTGMVVQPNKAIVGANAFAHEAGIHQDGMLKHQETYEIMRPETVGAGRTQLVLGKHSGRRALATRLQELGYPLVEADLNRAFERFKSIADRRKVITDADLEALVSSELYQPVEHFALDALQVAAGSMGLATATVRLRAADGQLHTQAEIGTGPVDAVYKAIDRVVQVRSELVEYSVHSVTEGIDALGEVSVRLRDQRGDAPQGRVNPQHSANKRQLFHGHGADTDILVASAKAYLAALNRLLSTPDVTVVAEPTDADRVATG